MCSGLGAWGGAVPIGPDGRPSPQRPARARRAAPPCANTRSAAPADGEAPLVRVCCRCFSYLQRLDAATVFAFGTSFWLSLILSEFRAEMAQRRACKRPRSRQCLRPLCRRNPRVGRTPLRVTGADSPGRPASVSWPATPSRLDGSLGAPMSRTRRLGAHQSESGVSPSPLIVLLQTRSTRVSTSNCYKYSFTSPSPGT